MIDVEKLKKEIETEYSWYSVQHRHEPNVAYVKCQWFGDDEPEDLVQTIVLDEDYYKEGNDTYGVLYINDDDVLYYCSSIESLIELCEDNGVSDFKIVEFIGFEHIKAENKD